jgi:hypothetical protein
MYAINSPVSDTLIEAIVSVNGTVKNYGANIYSFESTVNVYNPDFTVVFTQTMQVNNLNSLGTLNLNFGSFQIAEEGLYTVEMFTYAVDDTFSWNDTLITTFNSSDCLWESLPSPGIKAYSHTTIYDPAGDLFFIIGGDSTGDETNMDICLAFDPKVNTWDNKAPMFTAKRGHSASYRKGFIHVLCGIDNYGNKLTYHEVYDIQSDSWDLAAPAPMPVTNPGLVTWKDSLVYIIGGYDVYHNARTEVYYYSPAANSWDSATSLPRPFHAGGVKIKGDSIFIVGGGDGWDQYSNILIGEINPFNPSVINWFWSNLLPYENYTNALVIKDGSLYMIGGAFDMGTNQVWEYDIQGENWASLPDYPTKRILRLNFAEGRDSSESTGVLYCFMGDTSDHASEKPTDECYKLVRLSSGIEEKKDPEKNSISLKSTICLSNDITINYNIVENCDVKVHMYDILGREVFSVLEKNVGSGHHNLSIKENFESGIYFMKIEAGSTVKNSKLILMR